MSKKKKKKLKITRFCIFGYNKTYFLLYSKIQKLMILFFSYLKRSFMMLKKKYKIIFLKNKQKFKFVKFLKKKKVKRKNLLLLNVTFGKRNTFFNLTTEEGNTLYLTTVRREGYVGRKQVSYISLSSVSNLIKNIILNNFNRRYYIMAIKYKGWNRFRSAVRSVFNKKKRLHIKYIKYIVKIPHNGCRPVKQRNRSHAKKYFVRKAYLE